MRIITKLFHFLPSEFSHKLALEGLRFITFLGFKIRNDSNSLTLLNINFSNKLGLAAGLDKNGDYIDSLSALGFGFIEIGTVTPRSQRGNQKPRLFRIKSQEALVNSMGFNNKGVDYLVNKVKERHSKTPLGISIGKNFDTPIELALDDYLLCLDKVYKLADYVAINISSPNTKNLRDLQSKDYIDQLLLSIRDRQLALASLDGYTPILIKISPDMNVEELKFLSQSILENNLDGIICTNTTIQHSHFSQGGGLSGKPLFDPSTLTLELLRKLIGNNLPIIASGGVMDLESFRIKIDKGANLVQIYTGFIYEGPSLINEIINFRN